MQKEDFLLVIGGIAIGASIHYPEWWKKILFLLFALGLFFIVRTIKEKRFNKEIDEVIDNELQGKVE